MDCEGAGMWGCASYNLGDDGVGDSCETGGANTVPDAMGQDADEDGVGVSNAKQSFWTRRVRVGKAKDEREPSTSRMPALEASIHPFVDKKSKNVVNPSIGTSFDSVEEAYEFYNLYSWEVGFGVRYAKSRLNVHRKKCMQEIVCACAGKPLQANNRSTRCGCKHNTLYLLALDMVKLGDSNVEAHALAMEKMRDVKVLLEPVAAVRDGLGLSDRELAANSAGSGVGNKQHFGRAESEHSI